MCLTGVAGAHSSGHVGVTMTGVVTTVSTLFTVLFMAPVGRLTASWMWVTESRRRLRLECAMGCHLALLHAPDMARLTDPGHQMSTGRPAMMW